MGEIENEGGEQKLLLLGENVSLLLPMFWERINRETMSAVSVAVVGRREEMLPQRKASEAEENRTCPTPGHARRVLVCQPCRHRHAFLFERQVVAAGKQPV